MDSQRSTTVWIGLVEVHPLPNCDLLTYSTGAFVNGLTIASGREEFCARAIELMESLRLQVVGIRHSEPIEARRERTGLSKECEDIARDVSENPNFIRYATFHTWRGSII